MMHRKKLQLQQTSQLRSSFLHKLAYPQSTRNRTKQDSARRQRSTKSKSIKRGVPALALSKIQPKPAEATSTRHRRGRSDLERTGDKLMNASARSKRTPRTERKMRSARATMNKTRSVKQGHGLLKTRSSLRGQSVKDVIFPVTANQAVQLFRKDLTHFELDEIIGYPQVYCFGLGAQKVRDKAGDANHGFDDARADYKIVKGDHIAYRYEILGLLGSGSFGKVVRALDHKVKTEVALKIIRNKRKFHQQAAVEVKVLQFLKDRDVGGHFNVIHILHHFSFRRHVCIAFELLSLNLFDFLQKNDFQGLSLKLIRRFAAQLLQTLRAQEQYQIIHCDLKPENILLKSPNQSVLKVIDYGSSCFETEKIYTYIQSRFYRAPQVMLGISYTTKIDMWSFGCILAQLYTGTPLFPGECESEQMCCLMEVIGAPPASLLSRAARKKLFFDQDSPRLFTNSRGKTRLPLGRKLSQVLQDADEGFVELVRACLEWDPEKRISAKDALNHEWIAGGRLRSVQSFQGEPSQARKTSLEPPVLKQPAKRKTLLNK